MNELGGISKHLTALTTLEKSLHLKQMQISGLLAITKGIGMNHPAADLFSEYKSFLDWVLGVKSMLLFVRENGKWDVVLCAIFPYNDSARRVGLFKQQLLRFSIDPKSWSHESYGWV